MPQSSSPLRTLPRLAVRFIWRSILYVFPFHAAAWEVTAEPIRAMLHADTKDEKDRLTGLW